MQFCNDEITWSELFDAFRNIYDKVQEIEDVNVLQGLALARLLKSDLEEFISRVQTVTLKAIVCEVLSAYDLEEELSEVDEMITQIYSGLTQLDSTLSNINNQSTFQTLAEVETVISPIIGSFLTDKENLESSIDAELEVLFQPLVELGASPQQIKDALEEIELSDSPTEYILDVFLNIADKTLEDLS